jgi:hypothetical protein
MANDAYKKINPEYEIGHQTLVNLFILGWFYQFLFRIQTNRQTDS